MTCRAIISLAVASAVGAGCDAARAPGGEMADIDLLRGAGGDYVYVSGGLHDGAAMGQTTYFIVTPDDRRRCLFVFDSGRGVRDATRHDDVIPGLYAALSGHFNKADNAGAMPDMLPLGGFVIEVSQGGKKGWIALDQGDPRHEWLLGYLGQRAQDGCWNFG